MTPLRIVVSGMGRERMQRVLEERGGEAVVVLPLADIDAVGALQRGEADVYMGACLSGAGGALAMATALLGPRLAIRISGLGAGPDSEHIRASVAGGARAFGMATAHIEASVAMLLDALLERRAAAP